MRRRILPLVLLLALCAAVAGGAWVYGTNAAAQAWVRAVPERLGLGTAEESGDLLVSGLISAGETVVAAELGGRILALHAGEGDPVAAGQVLVELDGSLLVAQIGQAQADLALAEAQLAQLRAGVRPEKLAVAKAQLAQARTAQEATLVAWQDAEALRDNPQDLELALLVARTQLGVLDSQQQQAEALANSADSAVQFADAALVELETFEPISEWVYVESFPLSAVPPGYPVPPDLHEGEYRLQGYRLVVKDGMVDVYVRVQVDVPVDLLMTVRQEQVEATYQAWQAWTGVSQAQSAYQGLEDYLGELSGQVANPLTLQAKANAAEAQTEVAAAAVAAAQTQIDGLSMGATAGQIATAEAQVAVARAALDALEVQAAKFTLQSPLTGLVLERSVHVGEVALPGAPLLTLVDLDQLTLTVYVPQTELGKVQLGQDVEVTVDAYPGRVFHGTVSYIAGQAEYTPKNVQTRDERANIVFAVKIKLPNPDQALKPGMPADARLAVPQPAQ